MKGKRPYYIDQEELNQMRDSADRRKSIVKCSPNRNDPNMPTFNALEHWGGRTVLRHFFSSLTITPLTLSSRVRTAGTTHKNDRIRFFFGI
jgi:hypothetical protein